MEEEQNQRNFEREEAKGDEARQDEPAYHPSPPPDKLFDISTTVDPSYIISLIRKLLPMEAKKDAISLCSDAAFENSKDADHEAGCAASSFQKLCNTSYGESESMDVVCYSLSKEQDSSQDHQQDGESTTVERWEEYGCILWDLAAGRTHAELMVENLILEVLRVNIMISPSPRVTEISLGIIGNLACHSAPLNHIESTNGMIDVIVEQLFLDDTQCLNEACRILTSGLCGPRFTLWFKSLQSEHILCRILWIVENTLNPLLLEKSVGVLLAIIEGQSKVGSELLLSLMSLGLTSILVHIFSFEMDKLKTQLTPERYSVLEAILSAMEALSAIEDHSQEICSNKELFQLVCSLIKCSDKAEIASSCVTAGVLISNMMSDRAELSSDVLHDFSFVQGMFDILPYTSGDNEAKGAIWSVIARLLVKVYEAETDLSSFYQYVLILVSKCELIEEDLLDNQFEESNKECERLNSRLMAIRSIVSIMKWWNENKNNVEEELKKTNRHADDADVERLMDRCSKYIDSNSRT